MTDATWLQVYESELVTTVDGEWEIAEIEDLVDLANIAYRNQADTDNYSFYAHPDMIEHLEEAERYLQLVPDEVSDSVVSGEVYGFQLKCLHNLPPEWVILIDPQSVTNGGTVTKPVYLLENILTPRAMRVLHGGAEVKDGR